jgi:hypothetical protein
MCCSISSIHSWFREPIVLSKEVCRLAVFTTIALLAIGLATYCYFYGTTPGYNEVYAYCLWGITGGAIFSTLVIYIARAILSREFAREQQADTMRRQEAAKQAVIQRYHYIYEKFFPENTNIENLPPNLLGPTGYFDRDKALEPFFVNGCNVIRCHQDGRPCIGIKLAIHHDNGVKMPATLLIAPNPNGFWFVHASFSMHQHIFSNLQWDCPESNTFIDWITGILNGEERFLLQQDENWTQSKHSAYSYLIEKTDGPKVSLWQD